jgi:adenylosuccinate lyase
MERQAAYVVVQRNAMRVWDEGRDFQSLLREDAEVKARVPAERLDAAFDLQRELRHVDAIFERVLAEG